MLAGLHHVGMSPRPESNRRPPDSKSGVPRRKSGTLPSLASLRSARRQRRLRGSTQPQLSLRSCWLTTSVRSARTESARSCIGTNGNQSAASLASRTRIRLCPERVLGTGRRQSRVPRPLTGSPYGGRVMRVRVSGRRRIASNSRIRSRRGSGGLRPGSSHADLVGTRRTRDPRLSENEHAAG